MKDIKEFVLSEKIRLVTDLDMQTHIILSTEEVKEFIKQIKTDIRRIREDKSILTNEERFDLIVQYLELRAGDKLK